MRRAYFGKRRAAKSHAFLSKVSTWLRFLDLDYLAVTPRSRLGSIHHRHRLHLCPQRLPLNQPQFVHRPLRDPCQ